MVEFFLTINEYNGVFNRFDNQNEFLNMDLIDCK
jgi:hypothetical protein